MILKLMTQLRELGPDEIKRYSLPVFYALSALITVLLLFHGQIHPLVNNALVILALISLIVSEVDTTSIANFLGNVRNKETMKYLAKITAGTHFLIGFLGSYFIGYSIELILFCITFLIITRHDFKHNNGSGFKFVTFFLVCSVSYPIILFLYSLGVGAIITYVSHLSFPDMPIVEAIKMFDRNVNAFLIHS